MDFQTVNDVYGKLKQRQVLSDISPDDTMYTGGKDFYFPVGESGLLCILRGLSYSWLSSVTRVLDLPCGHGRVGRFIRAAFPDAEMFFCDIDRSGVDFCASHLQGTGIYSQPELTDVDLPGDLDVIWVGSLFTHLDEARTARWLTYLTSRLREHGILVATFHGLFAKFHQDFHPLINAESWKQVMRGYEAGGFGYAPYTEVSMGDYGVSLSRASKILDMAQSIEHSRVLSYTERGWAENHDVLVIGRNDRYRRF